MVAGMCMWRNTAIVVTQEVRILSTNQQTAAFLAPPSRARVVCLAPQGKGPKKGGQFVLVMWGPGLPLGGNGAEL